MCLLTDSVRLQIFKEAQTLLPGGVNSPVRAFKSVGGQPIIFERVEGPYCYDVDGNKVRGSRACLKGPTSVLTASISDCNCRQRNPAYALSLALSRVSCREGASAILLFVAPLHKGLLVHPVPCKWMSVADQAWNPVQYVDYVGSWGPAIVGHAHPEVTEALTEQIKKVRRHAWHKSRCHQRWPEHHH